MESGTPKVAGTGRKISQHFVIFRKRIGAKSREPLSKGLGSRRKKVRKAGGSDPLSPGFKCTMCKKYIIIN